MRFEEKKTTNWQFLNAINSMSDFQIDPKAFKKEARTAMIAGVQFANAKIIEMTPRDWSRPPKPIDRKDGKPPIRNTGRKPVSHGGHWYEWVTGNLRRSITYEEVWELDFIIWVVQWPTEEYARAQEFGTSRMPARSFLRRGIIEHSKDISRIIESVFTQLTSV